MLLDYDNLVIGADSDDSEDLEWLAEFLCPSFRRLDAFASRVADCRVRLVRDPAAFSRWEDRLKSAGDLRTRAFLLDAGPVNLGTIPDGDALVAHDDFFNVFFRWSPATGRNAVDIIDGDPVDLEEASHARRARVPLMRAVREWAMHHAFRRGRGFLHAAAVVRDGKALLLAGPKRSGKTSLLTAILQARTDVAYLANDRVMVSRLDAGVVCRGMPSIVSVRPGSLEFLPGVEPRLRASACGHTSRSLETTTPVTLADGRYALSPAQFRRVVDARPVAEAGLAAIVFPRVRPEEATLSVRPLSAQEATQRLAEAVFGLAAAGGPSAIFDVAGPGNYPDLESVLAKAARLANDVPCLEVGLGRSAFRTDVIGGMLDRLFLDVTRPGEHLAEETRRGFPRE
jgi:hypothetical protein